ncbi:hypothetical protein QUB65_26935 [Microcoleus sp. A2-D2]
MPPVLPETLRVPEAIAVPAVTGTATFPVNTTSPLAFTVKPVACTAPFPVSNSGKDNTGCVQLFGSEL